ncbi:MAG: methyltransferase domain-containing protein [Planctomycetota bacterium]
MHANSQLLFTRYVKPLLQPGMRVLEIGPDGFPSTYRKLVDVRDLEWETVDIAARDGITYTATDEYNFPIDDGRFDVVLSGQVLEHVRKVWLWIQEVARVTRPGGRVATISPVTWPYHEAPIDCWRIYPEGMRALYDEGGLVVEHCDWESLEPKGLLPRITRGPDDRSQGLLFKLARFSRYPLQRSFDTVTIGRKPEQA